MTQRIESQILGSNVFVVKKKECCVIFDTGATVDEVREVVGDMRVSAVFLTHGHYDHCFYALEYAKAFGCKIYASDSIREYLLDSDKNCNEEGFCIKDFSDFVFLGCDGTLTIEGVSIQYFKLGGHTSADMIYKIGSEIFVGDLIIGRGIGRMDLYGGNKNLMASTLQFLIDLEYKTIHSGHGRDIKKVDQVNNFAIWKKYLERY